MCGCVYVCMCGRMCVDACVCVLVLPPRCVCMGACLGACVGAGVRLRVRCMFVYECVFWRACVRVGVRV